MKTTKDWIISGTEPTYLYYDKVEKQTKLTDFIEKFK